MKDWSDHDFLEKAKKETFKLPEESEHRLENTIECLSEKKGSLFRWRRALVPAAIITLVCSISVTAAVNYVKQRMDSLNEQKIEKYFKSVSGSVMEADSFSRKWTDSEQKRLETLEDLYRKEGQFPQGELKIIEEESEYNKKGLAFQPFYSKFFLPENEMTDEELLQYIDFFTKRNYSLQEMNRKIEEGEADVPDNTQFEKQIEDARKKVETSNQNVVIDYNGDMKAQWITSSEDYIYFSESRELWNNNETSLYAMKIGEKVPHRINIEAPEDMQFYIGTTDIEGNLCVLLMSNDGNSEENRKFHVWKLDHNGKLLQDTDVSKVLETSHFIDSFAVDKEGIYYFNINMKDVVIADETGMLLNKMEPIQGEVVRDKEGNIVSVNKPDTSMSIRAIGRGKDGRIYATMLQGNDALAGIVELDAASDKFLHTYSNILPDGEGAYDEIQAGFESDLLIFGTQGIYSYNLGDKKATLTIERSELPPIMQGRHILKDGRVFATEGELINFNEESNSFEDFVIDRFYFISAKK